MERISETGRRELPADAVCGDFDIRIDGAGTWHYQGSPIGRPELVRLFASVLRRDEHGEYWLETPVEKGRIRVEDAPFVAIRMTVAGAGETQSLTFESNVGERATAGPDHPIRIVTDAATGEPSPYVTMRGNLEAKIGRAVYYDLVELAVERDAPEGGRILGVWSDGVFFVLGHISTHLDVSG